MRECKNRSRSDTLNRNLSPVLSSRALCDHHAILYLPELTWEMTNRLNYMRNTTNPIPLFLAIANARYNKCYWKCHLFVTSIILQGMITEWSANWFWVLSI